MQPQHQLAMRAADVLLVGARLRAEDFQRLLLASCARPGRGSCRIPRAPCPRARWDGCGRGRLRRAAPIGGRYDGSPAIEAPRSAGSRLAEIAAGEHALQDAPVHLAGVVVELHLQMIGLDARGLPRRAPRVAAAAQPRWQRAAPDEPRAEHAERNGEYLDPAQHQERRPRAATPRPRRCAIGARRWQGSPARRRAWRGAQGRARPVRG